MVFEVISKGEQVTLATETGDDGTLLDKTACLSDASLSTSCVEVKAGQGIRAEWPHNPGAMSSVTLRIGIESLMAAGTARIAPYSDSNSIDDTNGKTTANIDCDGVPVACPGSVDESLAQALIDDCLTSVFTFRMFENGSSAKIKTSELSIEATIATIDLIAESRDDDDNLVVSTGVVLFRRTGSFPYTYTQVDSATTNGTTGLHTFSYEDDSEFYRIFYMKELTPDQWDMSDEVKGV